jgi:Spy/CpxP family protein refolding chaperone
MNRFILAALAAIVLTAGPWTSGVRADDGDRDSSGPRAEWAAKRKEHFKKKLELTDDQAAKLEAAFKSSRDAAKPLREKAREARRKLADVVRSNGSDADVAAALKEADASREALQAQHRKLESALSSILKPRQLAKLRLQRERMMHRRMAKGWGGRRRGGEGGWGGRGRSCGRHRRGHRGGEGWGGRRGGDGEGRGEHGWNGDE